MDWLAVALRFALYVDLMVVFGLPLFVLYAFRGNERSSFVARRYLGATAVAALVGIALSLAAMAATTKEMTGADAYSDVAWADYEAVVSGTDFGMAWSLRITALVLCAFAAWLPKRQPRAGWALLVLLAAVALASLAWAGHGAMNEGLPGRVHLLMDVAHLAAAAAWVGAITAFLILASTRATEAVDTVVLLNRTANGFAKTGTLFVTVLAATGAANYWFIVGPVLPDLSGISYGTLLLAKLVLVVCMLGLAAVNRFRLSPALERAMWSGNEAAAIQALRRSLSWEASAALLILVLVAWLGMLPPQPA
jgi:putative copper resistance protein D